MKLISKSSFAVLAMVLAVLLLPAALSFAAPLAPTLAAEQVLTNYEANKKPFVATGAGRVHVSWSLPDHAQFAERAEEANGAFSYATLGTIGSNSTYYNAVVAVGTDGSMHYAWVEDGTNVHYRRRAPGQNWTDDRVIASNQGFAHYPAIAVQGSANVWVTWRLGNEDIAFAYSNDGGSNWPISSSVGARSYAGTPRVASSPLGGAFLTWTGTDGHIFLGAWNGSDFGISQITKDDKYFEPTVAVAPNGQVFLAWRHTDRGVFYAASQSNGTWSISNVFQHPDVRGAASIAVDGLGNVNLAWISRAGGSYNTWYAIQKPGESFSNPIVVSNDGGAFKANPDLAVSTRSDRVVAHIVWESFNGGSAIRYARAETSLTSPDTTPTPTPQPQPTPNAPATGVFDFASSSFRDLWTRTDSLVQQNAVNYSWIWGPSPFTQGLREYYVQSPGQSRVVQYYDKSRMEINQPDAPRGAYYVTNGRLADELITGLLQTGDAQYDQRNPAAIAVAGDPQNTFPLYQDLRTVYRRQRPGDRANEEIFRALDGSVQIKPVPGASTDPAMLITQRVGGIGIPRVFWDYMNRPGRVVENGRAVTATPLFDWRYVIGEPLTEAYWTYIRVNGRDQGVLVQAFERRVLTYTPANPGEFQVEMGNIGRHYFEWRYGAQPR